MERKPGGAGSVFDKKAQFELRRQALIAQAARVFNELGSVNASLDDVSASVNITKPALYHYFKSKDELLYECFLLSFRLAEEAVEYADKHGENGSEKIRLYIERHLVNGLTEEFPSITAREQDVLSFEYSQRIKKRRRKRRDHLRRFVEEGIRDGSIQKCDPKVAIMIVNGALSWIFRVFQPNQQYSPEKISAEYAKILIGGLAGPNPFARPEKRTDAAGRSRGRRG